ncbi:hypothetical protein GDO86_010618, partial [Hymenochirus boettgeri]
MMDVYFIFGTIIPIILYLLGMIVNGFIVVTYLLEWKSKKSLKPTDTVLMCLGVTRMFFNLVSTLSFLPYKSPEKPKVFRAIWNYFNWSGLWFISLLSVIYCTKIANYNNRVFIYMKLNISTLLKWLILGNVLTSLVFSVLLKILGEAPPQYWINSIGNSMKNSTDNNINSYVFIYLFIYHLGSSLPFIMFCVSALLLICSLWSHTQQIKSSGTGLENSHLKYTCYKED